MPGGIVEFSTTIRKVKYAGVVSNEEMSYKNQLRTIIVACHLYF